MHYDDELYAQIKNLRGEDVGIRMGEVPLKRMAEPGLGEYNEEIQALEADFNISGKEYALRCVVDTLDNLAFYFNYHVFRLTL